MIVFVAKTFKQLTTTELYEILQLRSQIFVVEQTCIYQDLDGKDLKAIHILGRKKGALVAYSRLFKADDYLEHASIGRVAVKEGERQHGYGLSLMKASIQEIEDRFHENTIVISAQTYLKKFYNALGFKEVGEGYLEDGIPHIKMLKKA